MTNRREVLQGGIALTSLPIFANFAWSATRAGPAPTVGWAHEFYRIVFDNRFAAARDFGAEAARRGFAVHGFSGDITAFWYHELDLKWRREPLTLAGMTLHGPLFCLERLAWDVDLRVLHRVEQGAATAGDDDRLISWVIGPRARGPDA